jgi:maltooligosyltrehalose trehalohydrolase
MGATLLFVRPETATAPPRLGAEVTPAGVRFGVWAPRANAVAALVQARRDRAEVRVDLSPAGDGYHEGLDPEGRVGDRYFFSLDDGEHLPDPASRWQPDGVEGASMVIDPRDFSWTDRNWAPPQFRDLIIYELHVGTFTAAGTFRAVIDRLDDLRDLGVRAVELLPVGDFPGDRNWGYDGVMLFAPARVYGTPDDLRALVDAAHALGIAVILDVVYNHLGPQGNRLRDFSPDYFDPARQTPWGDALHFDGPGSGPVRAYFCENLRYWVREFHIDGFRLDATHAIHDLSEHHILRELRDTAHACGAFAIAEDERNQEILLSRDGFFLDGAWADDFHHSLEVALTPQSIYAKRFTGNLRELAEILQHGWTRRPVAPDRAHLIPQQFICCISNHDQVGNRPNGTRLSALISPESYRAASALLCLQPGIPLIFMGQEWAASTPFQYFTDHSEALGRLIHAGRRKDLERFDVFARELTGRALPDPQDPCVFEASKLRWEESHESPYRETRALYRRALALRRDVPFCRATDFSDFTTAEIPPGVLALRSTRSADPWLLLYFPGGNHELALSGELITSSERPWQIVFSSNDRRFGGVGIAQLDAGSQLLRVAAPETILLHDGTLA